MREALGLYLGKSLMAYRIVSKASRVAVAEQAGISRQALAKMEEGAILPALPTLYALAEALDCEPSDLLPLRKAVR